MARVAEDKLLKGSGKISKFEFDRYDYDIDRMIPYGKGFLHVDVECRNPKSCREKSHAVFFTWKEVVRGVFSPVIGTKLAFVALPAKEGQAPRAISLKLLNGEGRQERERPEKTIPAGVRYSK